MRYPQEVTVEFVKQHLDKAWTCPSYLLMRGICYTSDREMHDFLEKVARVMRDNDLENIHEGKVLEVFEE